MRLPYFLYFLLFGIVSLNAQESNKQPSHTFSFSYFGETITHPGVSFAYNKSLKNWRKVKVKKNGKEKLRAFNLSWSNKMAFYYHGRNHNGNILATGAALSMTRKKNWVFQFGLFSGGNLRYFNEDVFELDENKQVEKIKNASNLTFIYGIRTSISKGLQFKETISPYSIFLGSNIFWSTPFGTNSIFQNAIELGVKYRL
jgi:hypothetical protein